VELQEAIRRGVVERRGRIYSADPCSEGSAIFADFYWRDPRTIQNPITITCDNQGAIALSKDNKFHTRTKHIDIRYHFIREAVGDGKIKVEYIPTDENPFDIFSKPLTKAKFRRFAEMLGVRGT